MTSIIFRGDYPRGVWGEFNATYLYCLKLGLNKNRLSDEYCYFGLKKGSADHLYNRIVLLKLVAPYSLRSAELEQLYFGLLPWLDGIKLINVTQREECVYLLDLKKDKGPEYQKSVSNGDDKYHIDCTGLVRNLELWQESGDMPKSTVHKGISKKLLAEVILKLKGGRQRHDERLFNQAEQVEVVIGLQNIDVFLGHIKSLISENNESPIPKVIVDDIEDGVSWGDVVSDNWDALHYSPTPAFKIEKPVTEKEVTGVIDNNIRRHIFGIENESEHGVCLSCSSSHGAGFYIGELMFIRGFNPEVWTLGIIRWMTVKNKKLEIGLYLLSAHVDQVIVSRDDVEGDITINALWLADGQSESTILLPSAGFKVGDELHLDHKGDNLDVILENVVWHSEGFSQFTMVVQLPEIEGDELQDSAEFLIPAWAK